MSYARKLLRGLDLDLIERIEAGGKPKTHTRTETRKEPRPFRTYRQNGRAAKANVKLRSFSGRIRLNTTQNRPSRYAMQP